MPKNQLISSINSSCWVIWLEATNIAQIKQLSRWIYSFPWHLKVGIAYIIIWDLTINAFQTSANLLQQQLLHWEPAAERATSAQAFSSPRRILTVGQKVDQKKWKKSNTTSHVIWSSARNMLSLNAREASRNPKKSALLNDTSHPRICRPATKIGVQTLQNATWILAINHSVSPIILGNMSNHPQIEDENWLPGR